MIKRSLKALLLTVMLVWMPLKSMEIDRSNLFVPASLGNLKVLHDENGFHVIKDGEVNHVQNCFLDKEIRNLSDEDLQYFLGNIKDVEILGQEVTLTRIPSQEFDRIVKGETLDISQEESEEIAKSLASTSYLSVVQFDNGDFCIHAKQRLLGGGLFGASAGFWTGKFLTHLAAQAVIGVATLGVSLVATPVAGTAFFLAAQATVAAPVEAASNVVGLSCGIAGAVLTGPV